jgi:hypothetical protein
MLPFTCPVCGSQAHEKALPYLSGAAGFLNKQIYICAQCSGGSMFPMIDDAELSRYYGSYWKKHDLDNVLMDLFAKQAKARYLYLEPYLQKAGVSKILDIGAGFGLIRCEFPDSIDYEAIEVDPDAKRFLKDTIHASAIWADARECKGVYNLIILSHIIEHMPQPVRYLKEQLGLLAENGIVFIEVPNMDYRYKVRNEPHVVFFNPASISHLVEKAGLRVLAMSTCGAELSQLERGNTLAMGDSASREGGISMSARGVAKKVLPSFYKYMKDMRAKHRNNKCFEYGQDRQWIRLVAGYE